MWVEDLPNGKYRYVERFKNEQTGKNEKVSLTHTKKNKRVEKEMLEALRLKFEEQIAQPKSKLTFKDLAQDWLAVYRTTVKPSTLSRTTTHMKVLLKEFGSTKLTKLEASDFNTFYLNALQSERFKYRTVTQTNSIVKRLLRYAYKYKGLDLSHIERLLDVPKLNRSQQDEFKYLERRELKHILDHFMETHQEEYHNLAYIQAHTGLRYSEMASLRYEDIDFDNHTLDINRSYDFDNKVFTTPKTGNARIVYGNESISRILRKQMVLSQLKTMRYKHPKENTLLFKTRNGVPIKTHEFNKRLKQADVPNKNVTSHYFRHTFITLAIESGMNKDLIARQVGHADTTMIDRVYAHFTETMEKQQKEAMQQFKIV